MLVIMYCNQLIKLLSQMDITLNFTKTFVSLAVKNKSDVVVQIYGCINVKNPSLQYYCTSFIKSQNVHLYIL